MASMDVIEEGCVTSVGRNRVFPTEDMQATSTSYGGGAVSRMSTASYDLDDRRSSLQEARWSDFKKKMGLRSPVKNVVQEENEYDQIRKDMVSYVRRHFHMKECNSFVPKQDQNVKYIKDLKCHCGEVLHRHSGVRSMAMDYTKIANSLIVPRDLGPIVSRPYDAPPKQLPNVTWNKSFSQSETNAFGKIDFKVEQVGGKKPAKYVRVTDQDSVDDLLEMMTQYWRIMDPQPPNLVISVIGGAKNFKLPGRMRDTFNSGLIKAAKTTSAWMVTSGFNMGVMKAVGQAVHQGQTFNWDNDRITHTLRCIAVCPWGYVEGREGLESNDKAGCFPASYKPSNEIKHGHPVPLNPDHTHFIFVDDGNRNKYGGVADFRAQFEKKISLPKSENGLGIPVVLVVVEGGTDAIMDASKSLKQGIPVVVCAGTGRAADILAYAFTHTVTTKEGRETKLKHIYAIENKIQRAYGKSWVDKNSEEELKKYTKIVLECCQREDMMIVFYMNKHEDLDLAILSVLLKARSGDNEQQRLNQLRLALTWNRSDMAQEEIFREDVSWSQGGLDDVLTEALIYDKVDFVRLILGQGVVMNEYLTIQKLEHLYNSTSKFNHFIKILGPYRKTRTRVTLRDVYRLLTQLIDKYDSEDDISEEKAKANLDHSLKSDHIHFERPYKQLFIWAVLIDRQELARFFWEMGTEPITTAVAGTRIIGSLARLVPNYDSEVRERLIANKDEFEALACKVLDECHAMDPEKSMMLVERQSPAWCNMTCLQIAASAPDHKFLSSVACQNSINTTWKRGIRSSWQTVLLVSAFPFLVGPLLDIHMAGAERPSILTKIAVFFTAPITKFTYHLVSYVVFLVLYCYMVLFDCRQNITATELVCIAWIFTFLVDEIYTILVFPSPTFWGKIRDWYGFLSKIDFINLCLVFIGFVIRWFPSYFYVAKLIYCINCVIFILRIMKAYKASSSLGPKLYMIIRMLEEMFMFLMVLVVLLLAYGVSSQALLYNNRQPYWNVFVDIIYYPYWQLYGEIFLEEIETDELCLSCLANSTSSPLCAALLSSSSSCRQAVWLVPVLLGGYLLIGNILLLNLLIAIFSHVFDEVEKIAIEIWKFQMYFLVMEYDNKTWLVPPLSILQHAFIFVKWLVKKTCCRKQKHDAQYNRRHLVYLQVFEKEMMANFIRRKKAEALESIDHKFSKIQKRVDEMSKLIEDEVIGDQQQFDAGMAVTVMAEGKQKHADKWQDVVGDALTAESKVDGKETFEDIAVEEVKKHRRDKKKRRRKKIKEDTETGDENMDNTERTALLKPNLGDKELNIPCDETNLLSSPVPTIVIPKTKKAKKKKRIRMSDEDEADLYTMSPRNEAYQNFAFKSGEDSEEENERPMTRFSSRKNERERMENIEYQLENMQRSNMRLERMLSSNGTPRSPATGHHGSSN